MLTNKPRKSCCCSVQCFCCGRFQFYSCLKNICSLLFPFLIASFCVKEFNNPLYWLNFLICCTEIFSLVEFVWDFLTTCICSWYRNIGKHENIHHTLLHLNVVTSGVNPCPTLKMVHWHADCSQYVLNISLYRRTPFLYFSLGFVVKRNFSFLLQSSCW